MQDQKNSKMIEEIDVRAAKEGMELNRQLEVVGGLPTQTKSVLVACALKYSKNKESVETSEIYAEYLRICEIISVEPVKPRRVNDYLGELSVLGVLSVNKISRGRRRGVFNAIRPLADTGALMEVILQDYRFENLKRRLERV